jgi:hypothetical protein
LPTGKSEIGHDLSIQTFYNLNIFALDLICVNSKRLIPDYFLPMELVNLVDQIGENWTLLIGGVLIGAIFGAFAQQSKFCLRAAAIEFS